MCYDMGIKILTLIVTTQFLQKYSLVEAWPNPTQPNHDMDGPNPDPCSNLAVH